MAIERQPDYQRKVLQETSTGVEMTDQTAGTVGSFAEIEVQRNLCMVVPSGFPMILRLNDDDTPTEMPDGTLVGFGIVTSLDPLRPRYVGTMVPYRPWANLTDAEQEDERNQRNLVIDFGIPYIFLTQGEKLVLVCYHATASADGSECEFAIPYQEMLAEETFVRRMLEQRKYDRRFALGA